jgi:hypothetical protein
VTVSVTLMVPSAVAMVPARATPKAIIESAKVRKIWTLRSDAMKNLPEEKIEPDIQPETDFRISRYGSE